MCPEGWLTLTTPALGMSAANHSDLRNMQRPLEVQQLARSSVNTGHASQGDLCNPLRNGSISIKVQPAASVNHNQPE